MSLLNGILGASADIDPARSPHWLWPEPAELIYGSISSIVVFAVIYKFAGPMIKKSFADRTARIQAEMDAAADAVRDAEAEAADIRQAAGDIASERARLMAEAEAQAAEILASGRQRIDAEVAELEARAETDAAALGGRIGDELRSEIATLSSEATRRLLADTLDDAAQQQMIESFIQKVGSSS